MESGKKEVGVWIDEHGDFPCSDHKLELFAFHAPRCYILDGMHSFIDGFSKRDCPPDRQRLCELGDDHSDTRTVQPYGNTRSQVSAAAQEDTTVYETLERPLLPVLARMAMSGSSDSIR